MGIWKATGIPHCYTLECHYFTGVRTKKLSPMVDKATGEILPEGEITNIGSEIYENNEPPEFTVDVFEDVGRAVLAGILDLYDANPLSRLPRSQYKNLDGVKKAMEKYVDDTWGLDEKPEPKDDKRPANSLPRVALLGPKKKAKTFEEK